VSADATTPAMSDRMQPRHPRRSPARKVSRLKLLSGRFILLLVKVPRFRLQYTRDVYGPLYARGSRSCGPKGLPYPFSFPAPSWPPSLSPPHPRALVLHSLVRTLAPTSAYKSITPYIRTHVYTTKYMESSRGCLKSIRRE
jgi:hypothetical protein